MTLPNLAFARVEQSLKKWPRAALAHLPTPLDALKQLSANYPKHNIFLKRDDCTGLAMGGNKARQLEFYLGDAIAQKCDVVLSTGAVQSNYMRQLAAGAAKLGLECHIQLETRVKQPSQHYLSSGNVLLDKLFGAIIHSYEKGEDEFGADKQLAQIAQNLKQQGKQPYIVPLAPVEQPKGALGYVDAAAELVRQIAKQNISVDLIVVGSGSSLTHAGLLTGLRLLGDNTPVLGACVRRSAQLQTPRVVDTCRKVEAMLECGKVVSEIDVWLSDDALAPGYGKASNEVYTAINNMASQEGILLDPVYSGKTVACVDILIKAGVLDEYKNIAIIHTGGTPALFAYQEELLTALTL